MTSMKKGLLIYTNGTTEDKTLNMTNDTNNISILLNDKLTFISQILREPDKCNAVIMNGINSKNNGKLINRCIIPPFNEEVYGDIFIICMDENSEPQDFTMEDLEEYIANFEEKYKKNYYD
tara:strand:- start:48 stop:410 length:363 start_codon:yes stop_codon:yes gene_type:complete